MPIDLHMVTWNRPAMSRLVIETIKRNTKPGTYRLHVYDNASDRAMVEMLLRFDRAGDIILHLSSYNYGLETARQHLYLTHAEGPYFVCIDNDCLPQPIEDGADWLEKLVALMEKYPDFGAISARTQAMVGTGNIFEEADTAGDDIVEFPHPGGSFRIMRTDYVRFVGGWNRESKGRGAEERFIGGKLNEAGFRTAFAAQVRCLHLFGLRGENGTDRWGYDKNLKPEDTGHSDISHPALTNGDDLEEVAKYAGKELANAYRSY